MSFQFQLPIIGYTLLQTPNCDTLDLRFIDASLRRRLSGLAKITLSAVNACVADAQDFVFVYASEHGEIYKTTQLLDALAAGEELSPMTFSLSVLNASAGIDAIVRGNTAPSSAISMGKASLSYGLLEAFLKHQENPEKPLLFVYADERLDARYNEATGDPIALALWIGQAATFSLSLFASFEAEKGEERSQIDALVASLQTKKNSSSFAEGICWTWQISA